MEPELLFYSAYEDFYRMAGESVVFAEYCSQVFGADFSQDGFSGVSEIEEMLAPAGLGKGKALLDVGCGNGKTVRYIREKTGAEVSGFDYSENAIRYARERIDDGSGGYHFQVGTMDEMEYPAESFDAVMSVDTIYFALDLSAFLNKALSWLRPEGIFICAYQEGDIKSKTQDRDHTDLALALRELGFQYEAADRTPQVYELLRRKRRVLEERKDRFTAGGLERWYEVACSQSLDETVSFEEYSASNSRYLYWVRMDRKG